MNKGIIRLSPTSINTYRRCPRQFYYNYIVKIPQPSNIHLIKGNVIHKTLELFFKSRYESDLSTKLIGIFDKEWNGNSGKLAELKLPVGELDVQKNDCLNMLDIFVKTFNAKMEYHVWSKKAKDLGHAFNLLKPKFREKFYTSEEYNLCGFVDRINVDYDGVITVGDYKTSSRFGIGIKDEYDVQCAIYALLYKLNEGTVPDFTSIIYVRFGEEVRTRVTPGQINNVIEIIKDVNSNTQTREKENYPCKESGFCKWCSFFKVCSGIEEFDSETRQMKAIEGLKNKQKSLPEFGIKNPVKKK